MSALSRVRSGRGTFLVPPTLVYDTPTEIPNVTRQHIAILGVIEIAKCLPPATIKSVKVPCDPWVPFTEHP